MVIEFKGLEQLIRECIKSELQNFKPPQEPSPKKTAFISRRRAASILGISLGTLNSYCKNGVIPSYRLGSRVLLMEDEIIQTVQKVKTYKHQKSRTID